MSHDATHPHFIPDRWKPLVKAHIERTRGEERETLSAYDFTADSTIQIRFEDNSTATYRYAFCLFSKELGEVAIFTEHCGHYFYSTAHNAVTVEQLKFTRIDLS